MQLPFSAFTPQTTWKPPRPEEWPAFGRAKLISIDLENKDEELKDLGPGCFRDDSYIAGVGIAIDGGPSNYIPLRHGGGGNIENESAFWAWMHDQAQEFSGDMVNNHVAYDLKWMAAKHRIRFPKARRFWDPVIMDTLWNNLPHRADMDAIAGRLNIPGKDKAALVESAKMYGLKNPLAEMHKLPAHLVAGYNIGDTRFPLKAFPLLYAKLEAMDCIQLLELETELTPILVDMYLRGLRVNTTKLDKMENWYLAEEKLCCDRLKAITGETVYIGDCDNNERIGPILERHSGIRLPRSSAKKPKILLDDALLSSLEDADNSDCIFTIAHRGRKLITARAFCPQTREHLSSDGRIHATYNQTRSTEETLKDDLFKVDKKGAKTGRMSCTNTNLTQQPSRDPWAKDWRDIYEPEEDMQWFSADFSQQEPRITTMKAAELDLPMARKTALAYLQDETLDNHAFMAQLTGLHRKKAKNVYLGLVYGMGDAKLCRSLKLPTRWCVSVGPYRTRKDYFFDEEYQARSFRQEVQEEQVKVFLTSGVEGAAIIETFHKRAPFLKLLADMAKTNGRKFGVIRTMMNRHLYLPRQDDGQYGEIHATLNYFVQGSAADQMKLAMVKCVRKMPDLFLQGQVHDAKFGSVERGKLGRERAKEIGRIMRNAWETKWMLYRVDVAVGPSWGREHDMCYNQYCTEDSLDSDHKWCPEHAPKMVA